MRVACAQTERNKWEKSNVVKDSSFKNEVKTFCTWERLN